MDEPSFMYRGQHRRFRHNPDHPPQWAVEKYGFETVQNIMLDHIFLDKKDNNRIKIRRTVTSRPMVPYNRVPFEFPVWEYPDWLKKMLGFMEGSSLWLGCALLITALPFMCSVLAAFEILPYWMKWDTTLTINWGQRSWSGMRLVAFWLIPIILIWSYPIIRQAGRKKAPIPKWVIWGLLGLFVWLLMPDSTYPPTSQMQIWSLFAQLWFFGCFVTLIKSVLAMPSTPRTEPEVKVKQEPRDLDEDDEDLETMLLIDDLVEELEDEEYFDG